MKPSIRIYISLLLVLSVLIASGLGFNVSSAGEANTDTESFAVSGKKLEGGGNLSRTRQTCDTITSRILSSSDDAEQRADIGTMYLINSVLQMYRSINSSSRLMFWGLRFTNINVPQGAIITNAKITYRSQNTSGSSQSGHTFYGQTVDNATTFTSVVNDISSRTRTTSSVNWEVPQWFSNIFYDSPDLSSIFQEIVNRNGWQSGNAIVIIGETTVNQNRIAHSYDSLDYSFFAPLLTINYCIDESHTIGDKVWEDDGDGIQEVGEPGVADVAVTLFTSTGPQVDQTMTDIDGKYGFVDVSAGNYYLHFTLPDGYSFTRQSQGSDPGLDSDVDVGTGQTAVFTWNGTETDLTRDAGLKQNYVTKSDRTVTAVPDGVSVCCQVFLVNQTVSASAPEEGITTPATSLTLTDTVENEFNIVPGSITGCMTSGISADGKTLTCNWDAQSIDSPTIITYQIRKASAGAIATSGSYATHLSGSLQYTDHLGDQVALNYEPGTTTAALSGADACTGDIEIEKTLHAGVLKPGEQVVYRLVATNLSGFPISGFQVTDDLDPLLTFESADPAICTYSGTPDVTFGGMVTCNSFETLGNNSSFQIDLTVHYQPDATSGYPDLNSATVECPWCIVDMDSDTEDAQTSVNGPTNFQARIVNDILVSWETNNEINIIGFDLYRESALDDIQLVYAINAEYMGSPTGANYEYMDHDYVPGVKYTYSLEVLWVLPPSGGIEEYVAEVIGPFKVFLPFID